MTKEEVVLNNQNLIYDIIKKYVPYYDKDDLFQAGAIGLLKAYKNFDPSYNFKFSTFAYSHILGEVKQFVRSDKNIKVSREYISLNQQIQKTKELMSQRLMRMPTTTELSLFLEIDEDKLLEVEAANDFIRSLDADEDINFYNLVSCEENDYKDDIQDLRTELSNLSEEEKKLIDERYFKDHTQSETSNILGMSQVQVSRKETKILSKLKQRLVA